MRVNGRYMRIPEAELDKALASEDFAWELQEELQAVDINDGCDGRHFSIGEAWSVLGYLLGRSDFPVDIINGEQELIAEQSWGYNPPMFLPVERVLDAAAALMRRDFDLLIRDVTTDELVGELADPDAGYEPDLRGWLRERHAELVPFFTDAATRGDVILVWVV